MKGKRVFVSGGAGVIGRELVARLVCCGAKVFVGDLKTRPEGFPEEVHYRQGDLNSLTGREMEAFAPEIFIHLAATFERSTETYGFWKENFRHNVGLSHHLMTLAKDLPSLERVVFSSSYLIYDQSLYQFTSPQECAVSLKESDPVVPRNLTGMAKLAHEMELRFLEGFNPPSFTSVCARIYRGYGRQSRDVISRWVRSLLENEPITLYRPEGLFDYVYAGDSAEGLIRLASGRNVKGVINLGTGRARRVRDVVEILRVHFPRMRVKEADSDIPFEASQADMRAFESKLGWLPEYDLEQGIEEIVAHERRARAHNARPAAEVVGQVLVTSASTKVPLIASVQSAARKLNPSIEVIAGDLDDQVLARYVADQFWAMPRTQASEIDAIVSGCKERRVRTIIPTRDSELMFWALHRDRFASEGIDVVVSPTASLDVCLDKLAFARFGAAQGLPCIPAGIHPDEVGTGPYVVKERFGAGSQSLGLNLNREAVLEHGSRLESPIYQPFIQGREVSVDAWIGNSHDVKGLVLRTRDQVCNGESQVTTTFRDERLEQLAKRVLCSLKLRGPVVLQLLLDANEDVHLVELNSRFGGASTTSVNAGLDIFYWTLLESYGADVSRYPFDRVPGEIRQVRVPSDIYEHGDHF